MNGNGLKRGKAGQSQIPLIETWPAWAGVDPIDHSFKEAHDSCFGIG